MSTSLHVTPSLFVCIFYLAFRTFKRSLTRVPKSRGQCFAIHWIRRKPAFKGFLSTYFRRFGVRLIISQILFIFISNLFIPPTSFWSVWNVWIISRQNYQMKCSDAVSTNNWAKQLHEKFCHISYCNLFS
jgi:hypothetical protein